MIISHKYKYLFIELPRTGSTAISTELCENYDGSRILHKHATYLDFLKIAKPSEKSYFVFSGLRNPMDDVVSLYFKYKTDHRRQFSNPKKQGSKKGIVGYITRQRFRFVKEQEADFPTYFKKFYKIPYNNWSGLSHKQFDYIIRFENLAGDFECVLRRIGIEPMRPLPAVNSTGSRSRDFLSHYTPDTIAHAKHIFGPFMQEWGYPFPPEWGNGSVSGWHQAEYQFYNGFRGIYWRYLRPYFHAPVQNRDDDEE